MISKFNETQVNELIKGFEAGRNSSPQEDYDLYVLSVRCSVLLTLNSIYDEVSARPLSMHAATQRINEILPDHFTLPEVIRFYHLFEYGGLDGLCDDIIHYGDAYNQDTFAASHAQAHRKPSAQAVPDCIRDSAPCPEETPADNAPCSEPEAAPIPVDETLEQETLQNQDSPLPERLRALLQLPPEEGDEWTTAALAKRLGESEWKVKQVLKDTPNLFRIRKRLWALETTKSQAGSGLENVALLISEKTKILVLRKGDNCPSCGGQGRFVTRNSKLGERLERYPQVSLSTALAEATKFADTPKSGKSPIDGNFLGDFLGSLPADDAASYTVLYWGEKRPYLGKSGHNVNVIACSSSGDWLSGISDMYGEEPGQEALLFLKRLGEHCDCRNEKTEAFYWKWVQAEGETPQAGFPVEEPAPHACHQQAGEQRIVFKMCLEGGGTERTLLTVSPEDPSFLGLKCDLSSTESLLGCVEQVVPVVTSAMDRLGVAAANYLLDMCGERADEPGRPVEIETLLGRLSTTIYGEAAQSLQPKERLKDKSFLATEHFLATNSPYGASIDLLNSIARRSKENGDLVKAGTFYDDVEREQKRYEKILEDTVQGVYEEQGLEVDKESGEITNPEAIAEKVQVPSDVMESFLVEDWTLPDLENPVLKAIYEYNRNTKGSRITGEVTLEQSSDLVVWMSADDVMVHRQKAVRKNGGEVVKEKWVYHTVVHVNVPGRGVYAFEAETQKKAYERALAFMLHNGLQDRLIILFADGEETLKTLMNKVFVGWPHVIYNDYFHVIDHLGNLFSSAFKSGKIADPTVPPKYFKNGNVRKSSLVKITRSKYYKRQVTNLIWTGKIKEAVDLIRSWKGLVDELKSPAPLEEAASYLERKMDRFTCYAARHAVGYQNASNRVENANNVLVANRQKAKGMSWGAKGSFAVSSCTCVFKNYESELYYLSGELSFKLRPLASERTRGEEISWTRKRVPISVSIAA